MLGTLGQRIISYDVYELYISKVSELSYEMFLDIFTIIIMCSNNISGHFYSVNNNTTTTTTTTTTTNNNNNRVYTPLSGRCSQSRVFTSQSLMNHIIQYYEY